MTAVFLRNLYKNLDILSGGGYNKIVSLYRRFFMDNKNFNDVQLKIIRFAQNDVIATSNEFIGPDDFFPDDDGQSEGLN